MLCIDVMSKTIRMRKDIIWKKIICIKCFKFAHVVSVYKLDEKTKWLVDNR